MKPILQTTVEKFQNVRLEFYDLENEIIARLNDIIYSVSATCRFTFADWHTLDCSNGYASAYTLLANPHLKKEYQKMQNFLDMSQIEYESLYTYKAHNPILIIDGKELNVFEKLPLRWLYQDFSKELAQGRLLAMEKFEAKERAIERIKNRLTKKEIKLLSI